MNIFFNFGLMYLISCVEGTQGEKGAPREQGSQGEAEENG